MREVQEDQKPLVPAIRRKIHEIIFESDTKSGKFFDAALIVVIVLSALAVVLESVPSIEAVYKDQLHLLEWIFTGLFTVEYLLRIFALKKPWFYTFSFFGLVDLASILPMYVAVFFVGAQSLMAIRLLRLLRLFRLFKMARYIKAAEVLRMAFVASIPKITVFLLTIFSVVVILGSFIYMVEGHDNPGISSIPDGIYWAISTITTVGYGDVVPISAFGKFIASTLMIIGFGIFAVPTGIISVQLAKTMKIESMSGQACPSCGRGGHDIDSLFCKYCGGKININ